MKALYISLYVLGFTFEATIPVIILASVVPFARDSAGKAITFVGILACLWLMFQAYKRIKNRIAEWKRGFARASVFAAFKLATTSLAVMAVPSEKVAFSSTVNVWVRKSRE